MKDTKTPKTASEIAAEKDYPGAAIDAADDDKVKPCCVKQETALLNDNPPSDGE